MDSHQLSKEIQLDNKITAIWNTMHLIFLNAYSGSEFTVEDC